jgi:hypothetical protein
MRKQTRTQMLTRSTNALANAQMNRNLAQHEKWRPNFAHDSFAVQVLCALGAVGSVRVVFRRCEPGEMCDACLVRTGLQVVAASTAHRQQHKMANNSLMTEIMRLFGAFDLVPGSLFGSLHGVCQESTLRTNSHNRDSARAEENTPRTAE